MELLTKSSYTRRTLALIDQCKDSVTSIESKEAADELKIKLLIDDVIIRRKI